jgi:hypothetical protein
MGRPRDIFNIASVNVLDSIKKPLTGKLIVSLGLLIFVGSGISWYRLISQNQKNLMANAV